MELSKHLRDQSLQVAGKEQLIMAAMAKAFEIIPRQLCDNAGFDATNILNKLRQKHATGQSKKSDTTPELVPMKIVLYPFSTGGMWFGVDITKEDIADNFKTCVWEPVVVKVNAIIGATEAACLILSVDETIKSPKSNYQPPSGVPGRPNM